MTVEQFDEILQPLLERRPFRPFTVALQDGQRIEIELSGSTATRAGSAVYLSRDHGPVYFDHKCVRRVIDEPPDTSAVQESVIQRREATLLLVGKEIQEWLKRRPFEEFEVITSAGERHVIMHPEFAIITPTTLVVHNPTTNRLSLISLPHVTEIRPTASPQPEKSSS